MESDREANLAEIVNKIRVLLTGDDPPVSEPTSESAIPTENDALVSARVQRLTVLAHQVFGDEAKARAWLTEPQPHFRGKSILQLASHEVVARQIEEALRRIDEERIFSEPNAFEP